MSDTAYRGARGTEYRVAYGTDYAAGCSTAAGVGYGAPRRRYGRWYESAACLGLATDDFYPADNERGPRRRRREALAKQVCRRCTVSPQCLSWALDTREPHGVWGGLSADERESLLGQRTG